MQVYSWWKKGKKSLTGCTSIRERAFHLRSSKYQRGIVVLAEQGCSKVFETLEHRREFSKFTTSVHLALFSCFFFPIFLGLYEKFGAGWFFPSTRTPVRAIENPENKGRLTSNELGYTRLLEILERRMSTRVNFYVELRERTSLEKHFSRRFRRGN